MCDRAEMAIGSLSIEYYWLAPRAIILLWYIHYLHVTFQGSFKRNAILSANDEKFETIQRLTW